MNNFFDKLKDPQVRKYIYNVAKALLPILVVAGWLVDSNVGLILTLLAAILGFSTNELAAVNTDTDINDDDGFTDEEYLPHDEISS